MVRVLSDVQRSQLRITDLTTKMWLLFGEHIDAEPDITYEEILAALARTTGHVAQSLLKQTTTVGRSWPSEEPE